MFRLFEKNNPSLLDEPINAVLIEMHTYGPDSPEYPKLLEHLEKLYTLKTRNGRQSVDPNTIALVAGNILGILVIVAYEQKHVMTSKGLGFVLKPK